MSQLKKKMKKWASESTFGYVVYSCAHSVYFWLRSAQSDRKYAEQMYRKSMGKELNLDDPKHLNEKLWWLKLNNRDPMLTLCSDKYRVREYVRDCGYEDILIPQLGVYDNAKEIDFSVFTEETLLKCNHGSGSNFFISPKAELDEKQIRMKLNFALKQKYYRLSREWNYKNIEPKIIADKVIRDKNGRLPLDYRFFCFDGEPKLLMMDVGVINDEGVHQHVYPRNLYDMDFQRLPIRWGRDSYDGPVEKPENFERMVEIARKLSEPFALARVDLYNLDGKIYFGEITFYHAGGCQSIEPEEWDLQIASWIDLNSPKIVRKTGK